MRARHLPWFLPAQPSQKPSNLVSDPPTKSPAPNSVPSSQSSQKPSSKASDPPTKSPAPSSVLSAQPSQQPSSEASDPPTKSAAPSGPAVVLAGDPNGKTLVPRTYSSTGAVGLTGTLTLDDNGDPNTEWIFIIGGALDTAANAEVVGVDPDANVNWLVNGAITLGADSVAIGDMQASGAIIVGAGATCGNLDLNAAITLSAGAICGSLDAYGAITIGAGAYAEGYLFSDPGGITLGPGTYIATAAVVLTGTVEYPLELCIQPEIVRKVADSPHNIVTIY
jgi:hypothetical protein